MSGTTPWLILVGQEVDDGMLDFDSLACSNNSEKSGSQGYTGKYKIVYLFCLNLITDSEYLRKRISNDVERWRSSKHASKMPQPYMTWKLKHMN